MHILFLLTQDLERPSGLGRYWPLARYLARQGHRVEIAALHSAWPELTLRTYERDGVRIDYVAQMHIRRQGNRHRRFGPLELMEVTTRATVALARAALRSRADVVHIAKAQPMNGLAGWLARCLNSRQRLYLDCDDYEAASNHFSGHWQKMIVRWWEDHLPGAVRAITVNSTFLFQRCRALGVPAERLLLVSNGFDPERFALHAGAADQRAQVRTRFGLGPGPIVLYLGTLSLASHPVGLLLEAFEQVLMRVPAARLWLVGAGQDEDQVAAMVQARGLGQSVIQTGRIKPAEAPLAYAASTVSVDPVWADDTARARSPLKIIESLACGVPVVTGDIGDRATLLAHGSAGVLVQPGQAGALADGLVSILLDDAQRRRMGAQSLLVSRGYRWDTLAALFAKVYEI